MSRRAPTLLALLTLAGSVLAAGAAAQEALVWWPLVTDGREYRRATYPEEAGTLLVLADTPVVLEARRARVTWWPITREYLADVSGDEDPVGGTIEIVDATGEVRRVEPTPYVIWHPGGVGAGPAELVRGQDALALYDDYVRKARAAAERARAYARTRAAHQVAVEAWLELAAERRGQNMPPPPPELDASPPDPYHAYAGEPRDAAVTSLDTGTYTVRIRAPDGAVVAGSERRLTSFGPLASSTGYVVRPANRWTRPVISFTPDETLYTTGETDLFLQPVPVTAYRQSQLARLFRPQSRDAVDPELIAWTVRDAPIEAAAAALRLRHDDGRTETLEPVPYRVIQRGGAARGYRIEPFAAEAGALAPDFTAIRLAAGEAVSRVTLFTGDDGAPAPGSVRAIRTVTPPPEALLFLPALLPLAVGLGLKLRRAHRRKAVRR